MDPEEIILAILEVRAEETDEDGDLSPEGEQAVEELEALLPAGVEASAKTMPTRINAAAGPLKIQAAAQDSDLKRFVMLAYTGVPLRLPNYALPMVMDMAGMAIPKQRMPALRDHKQWKVIGHTETAVIGEDWSLRIEGVVSGTGPDAREVLATSKNAFPWEASIGADPDLRAIEILPAGMQATVNGQTFTGPLYIARKSVLKEISFVPLGADANTSASVAAQAGDTSMTWESWLIDLGWTVEDIQALPDEVKTFAQQVFEAVNAPEEEEVPVVDPMGEALPAAAGAKPPAVAAAAQAHRIAAVAAVDVQAQIQQGRDQLVAEMNRVAAIQRICPDATLTGEIDPDGRRVKKFPVLATAIQAGWTPQQAELVTIKASRSTAIPAIPNGGAPDPLANEWDQVMKSRQRNNNSQTVQQILGLLPPAGLR